MQTLEKALQLESFIKDFTPKGYREPIKRFDFAPTITEENYTFIESHFKNGDLETALKTYKENCYGLEFYRFDKPYLIVAIKEYFRTAKNVNYI
jgi:hypothetical protein